MTEEVHPAPPQWDEEAQQQAMAEVLELGEALFDFTLEAASSAHAERRAEGEDEPFPTADLRAAADVFFAALRALYAPH
jgi:hypothetical protein